MGGARISRAELIIILEIIQIIYIAAKLNTTRVYVVAVQRRWITQVRNNA